MNREDVEFIRDEHVKVETCRNPDCETCPERSTFLRLLTKSEAMREKANHNRNIFCPYDYNQEFQDGPSIYSCRHRDWSDADWIAAKEKEWGYDRS